MSIPLSDRLFDDEDDGSDSDSDDAPKAKAGV